MRNPTSIFLFLSILLLTACRTDPEAPPKAPAEPGVQIITGETMGTYYRVSYYGDAVPGLQAGVDSLLVALNLEVSTYIPQAFISRFNHGDLPVIEAEILQAHPHFLANLELAIRLAEMTGGHYNPTIMPLVNYWGFGYTPKRPVTAVDSNVVDSLMTFVGMDKFEYEPIIYSPSAVQLDKSYPGVQLDFSASAKGYGVDLVSDYLLTRGLAHHFVDIGGEARARGHKGSADNPWRVGISVPLEDAEPGDLQAAVPLRDRAVATSGNYRNVYEVDGRKYSHTINPFTGYPERSTLLSASILTADCATADGLATACMVMGLERAQALIDSLPETEAYFIYGDADGKLLTRATAGFQRLLEE